MTRLRRDLGDSADVAELTPDDIAATFTAVWDNAAARTWNPAPLGDPVIHHVGR